MKIGLGLRDLKSFEDGHKVMPISMLFLILGHTFNIVTKANCVPWAIINCFKRKKILKQHS